MRVEIKITPSEPAVENLDAVRCGQGAYARTDSGTAYVSTGDEWVGLHDGSKWRNINGRRLGPCVLEVTLR